MRMSDADLVSRSRKGDCEAFGQLVVRHEQAMLAIARAYFAEEADAQDATQEAFLKAFEKLGQLKDDRRFGGWLAQIVVNTCRYVLRTRSDRVSLAAYSTSVELRPRQASPELTPAALAGKNEEAELVRAALGRLPENQRVAVMLRYAEHLSYDGIAAYLAVPVSTIRGRLYAAKRALAKELQALQRGAS